MATVKSLQSAHLTTPFALSKSSSVGFGILCQCSDGALGEAAELGYKKPWRGLSHATWCIVLSLASFSHVSLKDRASRDTYGDTSGECGAFISFS